MISFLGIISGLICILSANIWIILLFSKDIERRKYVGIIFLIFGVIFIFCGVITPARYNNTSDNSTKASDSKKSIYSVEVKDIKIDENGYLLVTGRTNAPKGATILAQGIYDKDLNLASSEDGDLVKVKNSKFKIYLDTAYLYNTDKLKIGQKLKVKIFAAIGYKIKDNEFSSKLKKAIKKVQLEFIVFKATKELCKQVNDESDESDNSETKKKEKSDDTSTSSEDISDKNNTDGDLEENDNDSDGKELDENDSDDEDKDNDEDTSEDTNDEKLENNDEEDESNDDASNGKVIAGDSNEIIGDSVTGKYHMPGQARYYINEDRAVYFKSEKDAQDQGYVKSKR